MKKILGLAFAGVLLMACGSSNKSTTGMQNTTAANTSGTYEPPPSTTDQTNQPSQMNQTNPSNPSGDQYGGGSSIGSGQGNMAGSSTGPTGSGGNNSQQQDSNASSPTNNP